MSPDLCKIFGLQITYYGLMVAIGVYWGLMTAQRLARNAGIDPDKVFDLGIFMIVFAIIGARLFYIILYFKDFLAHPAAYIFTRAGFVFLGGLACGFSAGIIFALIKKLPIGILSDVYAPALALGHAIGRQGCLLNGCCYGKCVHAGTFFATHFGEYAADGTAVFRVPTQLWESLGLFIIFILLSLIAKKKKFNGEVFLSYVALYSVLRFSLEFFRGDYEKLYILGLTFSQVIILILLPVIFLIYHLLRKNEKI